MGRIKIDGYICERCNHIWAPRQNSNKDDLPTVCPKCKSPYWNKPRKKPRKIKDE
jgi:DNA-directed RNA polymerase subunit RPC12/RpoP